MTHIHHLSDDELLKYVYVSAGSRSELELELAARLEHLIETEFSGAPRRSLDEIVSAHTNGDDT